MSARGFVKASLGALILGGTVAALAKGVTSRRCARSGRPGGVLVATRIHLPEAAAASFRLDSVEKALVADGVAVRVLTSRAPADAPQGDPDPDGVRVSRWPVLRDSSGYLRGYVPYLSFDLPLALRLLTASRPEAILVERPPPPPVPPTSSSGSSRSSRPSPSAGPRESSPSMTGSPSPSPSS